MKGTTFEVWFNNTEERSLILETLYKRGYYWLGQKIWTPPIVRGYIHFSVDRRVLSYGTRIGKPLLDNQISISQLVYESEEFE